MYRMYFYVLFCINILQYVAVWFSLTIFYIQSFQACTTTSAQHHLWTATSRAEWAILSHIDCFRQCEIVELKVFRTLFIHVIRRRPGSFFQSSRISVTSALSSKHAVPKQRERDAMLGMDSQSKERLTTCAPYFSDGNKLVPPNA